MKTKGIGPQGLGIQGNNGYHIGSPAKLAPLIAMAGKAVMGALAEKAADKVADKVTSPAKLKDACYKKVKASYKVFPSAYASGAIAKCRKNK